MSADELALRVQALVARMQAIAIERERLLARLGHGYGSSKPSTT